jgi:hypothetical protein
MALTGAAAAPTSVRPRNASAAVDATLANDPDMMACSNARLGFMPSAPRQSIPLTQPMRLQWTYRAVAGGRIRRGGQHLQGQVILAFTELG